MNILNCNVTIKCSSHACQTFLRLTKTVAIDFKILIQNCPGFYDIGGKLAVCDFEAADSLIGKRHE